MLDSKSLEVISNLKLALLTRAQNPEKPGDLPRSNRGKKLPPLGVKSNALTPKVVEYGGSSHLVLTNDVIERSNFRNKRKWLDFYGSRNDDTNSAVLSSESEDESELSEPDDDDSENPLKKLRLGELLVPLAHPSELVTHPAISKTYKLTCLARLALELIDLIEIEQRTLNHFNLLLETLNGEDWFYLLEENMGLPVYDHGLDEAITEKQKQKEKEEKAENEENGTASANEAGSVGPEVDENKRITRLSTAAPEGLVQVTDPFFALPKSLAIYEASQQKQMEEVEDDGDELEAVQQDLVNYLQVSIQRQHEYIKNLTTLRNGIVKVDRYKSDLLKWGKEMNEKKS